MTQTNTSTDAQPTDARPTAEFRPLKAALVAGKTQELTLLIRLHPAPAPKRSGGRLPLNLSLVLDRSGSMAGEPLETAKEAIMAALRQLRPEDRVSVVSFDDEVRVEITSVLAQDTESLIAQVGRITTGGSTALYDGWMEGATQVASHLNRQGLNRVILLSDGQANQGLTDQGEIAARVSGLSERGVSTTTLGFGAHYDENLLLAMATSGDGNFEHIEQASKLPTFFESELQGLTRTSGRTVSLGLEPNAEYRTEVLEVLNDLKVNEFGRFQLPNLVEGQPISLVVRLRVKAPSAGPIGVTRARLAWTGLDGIRRKIRAQFDLPLVEQSVYAALQEDAEVVEATALLEMAKRQRQAVGAMDSGDRAGAMTYLYEAESLARAVPSPSAEVGATLAESQELQRLYSQGEDGLARKRAVSQSYNRSQSKLRKE
ncbi:vWA domain-containing protein [Deinococcus sp. UYEF24]